MTEKKITDLPKSRHVGTSNNGHDVCPVCLLDDVVFVKGKCDHCVCLPCMERILAAPIHRSRDWDQRAVPDDDAHLDVPTRGRCPMCRSDVCLFDLVAVPTSDDSHAEPTFITTKNYEIIKTDLKGRVYVQNRSQVGEQSLHFPSDEETATESDVQKTLPYIDFSGVKDLHFANGDPVPDRKIFEPDCHFHAPTRTFHGRLKWGNTCDQRVSGGLEWHYALAFSSDFQFVSRGVLTIKKQTCYNKNCPLLECKFPLDGSWRVSWPDDPSIMGRTCTIHNNIVIESHESRLGSYEQPWDIHYEDMQRVVLSHSSESGFVSNENLAARVVMVGESIEFVGLSSGPESTNSSKRMIWTRETSDPDSEYLTVLNLGAGSSQLYNHTVVGTDNRLPEYHEGTVWGNTFCQGYSVGLASYHFMEGVEQGVYISYEHERTSVWPPLDNGNPIPSRIWFTETSFDLATRTFRGKIDWEGKHGTTWQGSRWWRYVRASLARSRCKVNSTRVILVSISDTKWCLMNISPVLLTDTSCL